MAGVSAAPDFSVLRDQRLVAYLWRAEGGSLRRAGGTSRPPLCGVPCAEISCFVATEEALLTRVATACADFDVLLFRLGLEGFEVVAGRYEPHARLRRF